MRKRRKWNKARLAGLFGALVVVSIPGGWSVATADPSATAGELARLRVQVGELADALQTERATRRAELGALQAERAELERRVRLARTRNATLARLESEATAEVEAREAEATRWHGPAREAVDVVRAHVAASLPFATGERGATLDRIAAALNSPAPDVARSVERLWRFMEEEVAMGSEVALTRQTVSLDGRPPQLVEVLRLGMALMYVRTLDGQVGWARRDSGGWRFDTIDDAEARAIIDALFDAHEVHVALGPAELLIPPGEDADAD